MDKRTYNKTTEREFIGRKVKSIRSMSNGLYRFPAGMTFTIKRKQGGFELLSDPCPHCGIRATVSKVKPQAVEFMGQESQETLWPAEAAERI